MSTTRLIAIDPEGEDIDTLAVRYGARVAEGDDMGGVLVVTDEIKEALERDGFSVLESGNYGFDPSPERIAEVLGQ